MSRAHFAAGVLAALALGWLGGFLYGRRAAAPPPAPPAAASEKKTPAQPAPAPAGAAGRAEQAMAAGDWKAAAEAVDALIAGGEPGWDDAWAALLEFLAVEDPVEYALREEALDVIGKRAAFHKWAVPRARRERSFAAELYLELAWGWLGEAGEVRFLVEELDGAGGDETSRILHALEGRVTAELLPELGERAKEARGFGAQGQYLWAIGSAGAAAEPVLRELMASPEPVLAEGAAVVLQMVKPPVSGYLVLNLPGRGDRGGGNGGGRPGFAGPVHRGDIIVRAGGVAIDSEKAWREAAGKFLPRGGPVELELVRKGERMKVTVPAVAGLPKGRFVTAAK